LYIKSGTLDVKLSLYLEELFKYRDLGDYDLEYVPERVNVENLVVKAREFVEVIYDYLSENYFNNSK